MIKLYAGIQLAVSLFFLILWLILALIARKKAKDKQGKPAGIWTRFFCFGIDTAIINILICFVAYRGNISSVFCIAALIFWGYFFWFWLGLATTPGKIIVGIKILPKEGNLRPLKMSQVLLRLLGYLFLIFGWIWALGKEKRALHDRFAKTRVVYTKEKMPPRDKKVKLFLLALFGVFLLIILSLVIASQGERITKYTETDTLKLADSNGDKFNDVILLDLNGDNEADIVKIDIDYDHIIDQAFYDLDGDGRTDAIDLNNDGRLDGYDTNSDSKIDKKKMGGYIFIYLLKLWFLIIWLAGLGLIIWLILLERGVSSLPPVNKISATLEKGKKLIKKK